MKKKPRHKDTARLNTLIELQETGSSDFAQMLFFARMKRKTDEGAYRLALDQWRKERP